MRCLVVGAGLLGLTTAWFLSRHGVQVTVCERQPGAGMETSFANGGMLHASQASPWNEPGVLGQAIRMLGREDSALLIRPHALLRMLPWTWSFFRNSAPRRYLANLAKNARLAGYSLAVLKADFDPLALAYEKVGRGTLKIYRGAAELASAIRVAERCKDWNVRYTVLDRAGLVALEPALAAIAAELDGGIHFPDDVSGDAHQFCAALAAALEAHGTDIQYETVVDRVLIRKGKVEGAVIVGDMHPFDACVIAAGSYTPRLLSGSGVKVPVQPVKGYSLTLPMDDWERIPQVPVIDEHYHAAVCPLGTHLRIAGTAEFAGFDTRLTPARIDNLFALLDAVYPEGAARVTPERVAQWSGLRPMSPDGVGIMGRTQVGGLYLNTGHGHLGWTMAPGAGKLVAADIVGARPELALDDYALARF